MDKIFVVLVRMDMRHEAVFFCNGVGRSIVDRDRVVGGGLFWLSLDSEVLLLK